MKRAFFIVMLAALAGAQVREAEAFQKAGRLHEANDAFRAALKQSPNSADIRVRWGRLYLQTYQEDDAWNLFEEAAKIEPRAVNSRNRWFVSFELAQRIPGIRQQVSSFTVGLTDTTAGL